MKDITTRALFVISAFAFLLHVSGAEGQEVGVDRQGKDYLQTSLPDSALCKKACDIDLRCKAYTYVLSTDTCYQKDDIPTPTNNQNCISGVKTQEVSDFRRTIVEKAAGGYGTKNYICHADKLPPVAHLREVRVNSGDLVDGLQAVLQNSYLLNKHGGGGGSASNFVLQPNEHLVRVFGEYANYVDEITFVTDLGRSQHFGGGGGKAHYEFNAPPGFEIVGFCGLSGWYIDAIGVVFRPMSDEVIVSGCARPGVEAGCVILDNGGETYDIGSAVPTPQIGTYGTVSGTLTDKVRGYCMQGAILSPATWQVKSSKSCPH